MPNAVVHLQFLGENRSWMIYVGVEPGFQLKKGWKTYMLRPFGKIPIQLWKNASWHIGNETVCWRNLL